MRDQELRGIQAGTVAYVVWGLLTLYWKAIAHFDPAELVGWRIVCSAVVMGAVLTVAGRWPGLRAAARDGATVGRLLVAALLLAGNWSVYVWCVSQHRVLEAALGYFMAPLLTMSMGVVVLGEHPSRLQLVAVGFGAVAVLWLAVSYGEVPFGALAIAVSWSTYGLVKRRVELGALEGLAGETVLLVPVAVGVLAWLSTRPGSVAHTASAGDLALVLMSGIVTAVPLALFAYAARRVPFTVLGPLNYLVPIINLVLGWLVFDEPMPSSRLVGFALVWVALALVVVDQLRRPRRQVGTAVTDPDPVLAT